MSWLTAELKRCTGLSFDGPYAQRLGNMECFEPGDPATCGPPPVEIHIHRLETTKNQYVPMGVQILKKQDDFAAGWAHVVLRNNGETVLDRLLSLPVGFEQSEVVTAKEPISEFEVRIFNESGESLLWMEHNYLIAVINISANMVTGRKTYKDRLSEKLVKNNIPVGEQLEQADTFSPSSFQAGGYKHDPWVPRARSLARMVEARVPPPSNTRWFPRTIKGEGDALHYLRELIDSPRIVEAVLVDPFFGLHAFNRLVPRLRNISVKLTVLTSCLGWDPDEEWARGPNPEWEESARKQREQIRGWCAANRAVIPPHLTILDLRKGQDQAFHDRYLMRVDEQGRITIKMLSTSLNKMAGTYPCCFVDLDSAAVREVYPYIRGLALKRDITRCKNDPCGSRLDREIIWSREQGQREGTAPSSAGTASSDRGEAAAEAFPFQYSLLKWILDEPSDDAAVLDERARKAGLLIEGNRWIRDKEHLGALLAGSWDRFPKDTAAQARLLASMGEYWAHAHGDYDPLAAAVHKLAENPPTLDLSAILDRLSQWYASQPPPMGLRDIAPSAEALSAEHYLIEEGRRTFGLLSVAETFCTRGPMGLTRGLFGLRRLASQGLRIPSLARPTLRWIDGEHAGHTHICAAIVSSLVSSVLKGDRDTFSELLRSRRPFVQMFGVVGMFSENLPQREIGELPDFDEAVQSLRDAGIPPASVPWMGALPIPGAQAAAFRFRNLPDSDPQRQEAEQRLERLLYRTADLLVETSPADRDLDQLDAALRHTSRDRFHIAERCDEQGRDVQKPPWEALFRRCVADAEELMGLRRVTTGEEMGDFHFHEHGDYDVVEVSARSFARLHGEHWARPFRNRVAANVERVVRTASAPHLRHRDHRAWNNAVGQGAAGCLFGLSVCRIAGDRELTRYLAQNVERMVGLTCQVFLAAGPGWFDLAGLLDRLARETAWTVHEHGEGKNLSTALRAADDPRLPIFFRAALSTVPRRVFDADPTRAFALLENLASEQDPRTITRYFYLLDFLVGNSHLSSADLGFSVEGAVKQGLETFPDITDTWRQFFETAWNALRGDDGKAAAILAAPATSQSYCGHLLGEGSP